ncbi:MAG: polynucleotide adenylyltransferase PcnB [Pseudomonadota bacterium]
MNEPDRIPASEHGITRDQILPQALEVTDTLHEAGFQALLVGGCVRDLLLDRQPKDFDVATSATPEEVKDLFRRARLVGRRFRIAHVRVGREVLEVSTFRKSPQDDEDDLDDFDDTDRKHDEHGVIVRDNLFGTLEEDAFRRDLTINALYFDPQTEEVVDYCGGMADLRAGRIALIGEPKLRLTEDPVRLLRIVRFQAKLDFEIDPKVQAIIPDVQDLLQVAAPARLFDEVSKLFLSGRAERTWEILCEQDIAGTLFPCAPEDSALIRAAMANTDVRVGEDKPVTPGFLFAVMLWPDFLARCHELSEPDKPLEFSQRAADEALALQQHVTAVPRRFAQFIKETWLLQQRMTLPRAKWIDSLVGHPRFRAAYDFLVLRANTEEEHLLERADWWTAFQEADDEGRAEMVDQLDPGGDDHSDMPFTSDSGRGGRGNGRRGGGGRGRGRRSGGGGGGQNRGNGGGGQSRGGGDNRGNRASSGNGGNGQESGNSGGGRRRRRRRGRGAKPKPAS